MSTLLKNRNAILREFLLHVLAVVACLIILERLFKLRHANISVPFVYEGDSLFYQMVIKAIISNGWYLHNTSLGVPFGQEMHDFPMPDSFHFLLIKLFGFFTSNSALVENIFYLLTYPLITLTLFSVLRSWNISFFPSLLASILYSFTNYHQQRSQHHLMYSAYYVTPLLLLLLIWIAQNKLSFFKPDLSRLTLNLINRHWLFAFVICYLTASTGGAYLSFFSYFLIISVGIYTSNKRKNFRPIFTSLALCLVIGVIFIANLVPSIIYRYHNGKVIVAERNLNEAEVYGLKLTQLIFPIDEHRNRFLAEFKSRYSNSAPLVNENHDAALGFIASFGFLSLLALALYKSEAFSLDSTEQDLQILGILSLLNITAFLLATIGGVGAVFAYIVSPQIRGYNRISIFISLFSLIAIAIFLDRVRRNYCATKSQELIFACGVLLLTLLGLLDQSRRHPLPDFTITKNEYLHDNLFFRSIESSLPEKATIFQLPAHTFPEGESYDHLRGYLHTEKLRWSFGAMAERVGDQWIKSVAATPPSQMLETLALSDFSGVYLDRAHLSEQTDLEKQLEQIIGRSPHISENERFVFFDIRDLRDRLRSADSSQDWEQKKKAALNPIFITWHKGFSGPEGTSSNSWRWAESRGEMRIHNTLTESRTASLTFSVTTGNPGTLKIQSSIFNTAQSVGATPYNFHQTITIPPGSHIISYICDAKEITSDDPRTLVFKLENLKISDFKQSPY
jgi:phosphoglycerol transferase